MKEKIIKIIAVILMIGIAFISLVGIKTEEDGISKSVFPEYKLTDVFGSYHEIIMKIDDGLEEGDVFVDKDGNTVRPVPEPEINQLTGEQDEFDFEKLKENTKDETVKEYTIENRPIRINEEEDLLQENLDKSVEYLKGLLNAQNIATYDIRTDIKDENPEKEGIVVFEIPQKQDIDIEYIKTILVSNGKFEVKDSETGRVYVDNSHIDRTNLLYDELELGIFIDIELTNEGKEIFTEVIANYQEMRDSEGNDISKTIDVNIGDETFMRTIFPEDYTVPRIQIPLADPTYDQELLNEQYQEARIVFDALKLGKAPVVYKIQSTELVEPPVNNESFDILIYAGLIGLAILAVALIIMFRLRGIGSAIILVSYLGILLLIIRYTNIEIAISGIVGIIASVLFEFVILIDLNNRIKKNKELNVSLSSIKILSYSIVLLVISILFSFAPNTELSSIGMTLFMGIILALVHNFIFVVPTLN